MTMLRRRWSQWVVLSLVLMGVAGARAGAEVQLSGTEDKFVLRAKNATIGEIVSGIRSTLNVRIQLAGSTARQFTGAYAGSLRRVLSRLLDGEDYVISPAADGMTIVLIDRNGGARDAAAATARVGGGQEETNPVQGWVANGNAIATPPSGASPAELAQHAGTAQPVKLAADGDGDNNPVQGWTGSAILFTTPIAAAANAALGQTNAAAAPPPVKLAAADGDAENNPVQGWTGSGALFPTSATTAVPARQDATDAAKPQTTEAVKPQAEGTDGNPNVQGWEPAESPFKDLAANRAPAVADAPASAAAQDEGNPNVQGYMPDWSPPESGRSVTRTMPMPPGAAIGAHRQ